MAKENATTAEVIPSVTLIPISEIDLTGWNARRVKKTDPKVKELASSIQTPMGLIQPITVRDNQTTGRYDLVCGERRFIAHQVAGLGEIKAIVRDLTDEQVKAIMFTENAEREDLDPYEESQAISLLIGDGEEFDAEAVAAELGWNKTKVLRRRRLKDLIKPLREVCQEQAWPINMAEYLAAFSPDMQEQFANFWQVERCDDLKELRRVVNDHFAHQLQHAPFDTEIEINGVPPCSVCPKRTGCNPELFEDTKKDQKIDRCLDKECYNGKKRASLLKVIEENPELVQIVGYMSYNEEQACAELFPDAVTPDRYDEVQRSKAAPNAIFVYGRRAGEQVRIKMISQKKGSGNAKDEKQKVKKTPKEMTKAEAKAELKAKREVRKGLLHKVAAEKFKDHVMALCADASKAKIMCGNDNEPGLIALAFVVGATLRAQANEYRDDVKPMEFFDKTFADRTLKYSCGDGMDKNICVYLVDSIVHGVNARIKFSTGPEAFARIEYHTQLAKFLSLDYETFVEFAKSEQKKEPKTWDALKAKAKEGA